MWDIAGCCSIIFKNFESASIISKHCYIAINYYELLSLINIVDQKKNLILYFSFSLSFRMKIISKEDNCFNNFIILFLLLNTCITNNYTLDLYKKKPMIDMDTWIFVTDCS